MYIVIEASDDPTRIGRHEIKTEEDFIVNPNEDGYIEGWRNKPMPFHHGEEDAWVIAKQNYLSIQNLRAFSKREADQIKRSKTLDGLNVTLLAVTKERL